MTRHFLKFFRQEIGAASVVAPSPASMFAHPQGGDELGPGQAAALSCSPAAAPFGARLGDSPLRAAGKYFRQVDSWRSVSPGSLLTSWDIL